MSILMKIHPWGGRGVYWQLKVYQLYNTIKSNRDAPIDHLMIGWLPMGIPREPDKPYIFPAC